MNNLLEKKSKPRRTFLKVTLFNPSPTTRALMLKWILERLLFLIEAPVGDEEVMRMDVADQNDVKLIISVWLTNNEL